MDGIKFMAASKSNAMHCPTALATCVLWTCRVVAVGLDWQVGAQQRCLAAHANVMVYGDFSTNCLISCIKNTQLIGRNKFRNEALLWVKNGNLAVAARSRYFESRVSTSLAINFWRGIVPFLVQALPKYVSRQKLCSAARGVQFLDRSL